MAVTVRPLHDRLIVERIEDTAEKIGGIIIPDTAKASARGDRSVPGARV